MTIRVQIKVYRQPLSSAPMIDIDVSGAETPEEAEQLVKVSTTSANELCRWMLPLNRPRVEEKS